MMPCFLSSSKVSPIISLSRRECLYARCFTGGAHDRHSRPDNEIIGETLDELKKHGIIEPCESAWASPVVVVEKKEEGARRLCVEQRRVDDVTVTDSYPSAMPNAEALIDDLENIAVLSTLDMLSGFYQIPMDPADT